MAGDRILPIKVPFQVPLGPGRLVDRFVYVYVLFGRGLTLIDTGVKGSEVAIFKAIERAGADPRQISRIILTHSHPDHLGAARIIQARCHCPILAHAGEKDWIEDVQRQAAERPVPGFDVLVAGSVRVDEILQEGQFLDLDEGLKLQVLHTPGHSQGSISLYLAEGGALFCGDAVPQPGNLPIYEDPLASVGSLRRLMALADLQTLFSSWDDPKSGPSAREALDRGLVYLTALHEAVRDAARGDQSMDPMELCRRVVARLGLPEFAVNPLVAQSLAAHLPLLDHPALLAI